MMATRSAVPDGRLVAASETKEHMGGEGDCPHHSEPQMSRRMGSISRTCHVFVRAFGHTIVAYVTGMRDKVGSIK